MSCSGYGLLGNIAFRSLNSTHMCHLLLYFCIQTTLALQMGYFIFVMNMELDSFSISSLMEAIFSFPTLCFLCTTSLEKEWMERRWLMTLVSISDMSEGAQANKTMFLLSRLTRSYSSLVEKEVLIFVTCWTWGPILISFKSSMIVSHSASASNLGSQPTKSVFETSEFWAITRDSSSLVVFRILR